MAKKRILGGTDGKAKASPRARKTTKTEVRPADKPPPEAEPAPDIAVAQLKAFRQQLGERGYTSVFDVVRQGRGQTISHYLGKKTAKRAEHATAEHFYEQAEAQAAALTRFHRQLTARGEPVAQAITKLGIAYDAQWLERAIGSSGNYHDWFGQNLLYAHPDSVGSLFSPGSYLTTLYRAAKPLHPASHGLQLDKRRPDLARLTLSDSHLNQEVSTLALTLEVLEQGVPGDVEDELRTTVYPMNMPYNHAWEQIVQGLAVKKSSQREIWAVLGDYELLALSPLAPDAWLTKVMTPAEVRDRLGLPPELYTILTQALANNLAICQYYGRTSRNTTWLSLIDSTGMSSASLHEALGTGPFYYREAIDIAGGTSISHKSIEFRVDHPPAVGGYFAVAINNVKIEQADGKIIWVAQVSSWYTVHAGYTGDTTLYIEMRWGNEMVTTYNPQIFWGSDAPGGVTREVRIIMEVDAAVMIRSDFTLEIVLSASGSAGPKQKRSSGPISLIDRLTSPQHYGARYINGWPHALVWPPMYGYVGPHVGHPATEPSPVGGLYNNHYQPLERLNRIIRLQKHLPISFEELDWIIVASASNISDYPLTRPLQALSVYLPLRERYGLSVNAFVACIGSINPFHRPNELSFFEEMFGDNDFLGARLYLSPPRDDEASGAARARLCRGLGISADVFFTLARLLPGVVADTVAGGNGYVLPSLAASHVDALYRLVTIPRLFGLEPADALRLWDLLSGPSQLARSLGEERPVAAALGVLERTAYLVDWMQREELNAASLIALTTRDYRQVATPELQHFIQSIYNTLSGQGGDESDEQVLRDLLCRHIGAQFGLKPAVSLRLIEWMDAVAEYMNPVFTGYSVLVFWAQIQAACDNGAVSVATLEQEASQLVQYANLLGQFALLCHWAKLTEQDLELFMPGPAPSPMTGAALPPLPDLDFLVLLSRYRQWQKQLVQPAAEGRRYLQRAAAGEFVDPAKAALELALLHGWDLIQVQGYLDARSGANPKSFFGLYPLMTRMQLAQRLGQAPTDLALLDTLAGVIPDQNTLKQFAANVLAAAHA